MKHSGTAVVFMIAWATVLLGAYGVGLCIKEVRFTHAKIESKMPGEPQMSRQIQKPSDTGEPAREAAEMVQDWPDTGLMPDSEDEEDFLAFLPEESGSLREERDKIKKKKWGNPSGEGKQEFKAQMNELFGQKQKEAKKISADVSDEERAKLKEQWKEVKQTWKSTPEEERAVFGEKEKGAKREYPNLSDEEQAILKEEWNTMKKGMKKGWKTMSEGESEQFRG